MNAIYELSEGIGARPACSEAERKASEWCARRLESLGYEVQIDDFPARPLWAPWLAAYCGLGGIAALLIDPLPLVSFLLGVTAFVLYARDVDGRPLTGLRGGRSHNVVARPAGESHAQVVVLAHVDSPRASLRGHPRAAGAARHAVAGVQGVLLAVPLVAGAAWVAQAGNPLPSALWVASGLGAIVLLGAAGVLAHEVLRMPAPAGANGNASGVEVLMRLAGERPPGTWFVVTGSSESGMGGAQDLVHRRGHELGAASWLNLESLGGGTISAIEEEGVLRARRADGAMLDAAEEAGAEIKSWRVAPTDATVLSARHYRALSLMGLDERAMPLNWRRSGDTIHNLDEAAIGRGLTVARAVIASEIAARALA